MDFDIAHGSVIGSLHLKCGKTLVGKNNQDAAAFRNTPDLLVAVVCDGCGSGKYSEVGARLGANLFVDGVITHYNRASDHDRDLILSHPVRVLEPVRHSILSYLRQLTLGFASYERALVVINEYFLFSCVGFIITPVECLVFAIGDGIYAIGGSGEEICKEIGPFPGNEPPYVAFGLHEFMPRLELGGAPPERWMFRQLHRMPTEDLQYVMVGTDGVVNLRDAQNICLPGKNEVVGPLDQFWRWDQYFNNPDAVNRKLRLMNSETTRIDRDRRRLVTHNALLPDDTTLVIARKGDHAC